MTNKGTLYWLKITVLCVFTVLAIAFIDVKVGEGVAVGICFILNLLMVSGLMKAAMKMEKPTEI